MIFSGWRFDRCRHARFEPPCSRSDSVWASRVMVMLLGVGEVILEQAHAPALQGGGDLVVTGAVGPVDSARYLLSSVLGSDRFRSRTSAVSPSRKATLFLLAHDEKIAIGVRGGVPSREQAVGDPEVIGQDSWTRCTRRRGVDESNAWRRPAGDGSLSPCADNRAVR